MHWPIPSILIVTRNKKPMGAFTLRCYDFTGKSPMPEPVYWSSLQEPTERNKRRTRFTSWMTHKVLNGKFPEVFRIIKSFSVVLVNTVQLYNDLKFINKPFECKVFTIFDIIGEDVTTKRMKLMNGDLTISEIEIILHHFGEEEQVARSIYDGQKLVNIGNEHAFHEEFPNWFGDPNSVISTDTETDSDTEMPSSDFDTESESEDTDQ